MSGGLCQLVTSGPEDDLAGKWLARTIKALIELNPDQGLYQAKRTFMIL
jgi:hypothetical protein